MALLMAPSVGGLGLAIRIRSKSMYLFQKKLTLEYAIIACSARTRLKSSFFRHTTWVIPDPGKIFVIAKAIKARFLKQDFRITVPCWNSESGYLPFSDIPFSSSFFPLYWCDAFLHHTRLCGHRLWVEHRCCESHIHLKPGSLSAHRVSRRLAELRLCKLRLAKLFLCKIKS